MIIACLKEDLARKLDIAVLAGAQQEPDQLVRNGHVDIEQVLEADSDLRVGTLSQPSAELLNDLFNNR